MKQAGKTTDAENGTILVLEMESPVAQDSLTEAQQQEHTTLAYR